MMPRHRCLSLGHHTSCHVIESYPIVSYQNSPPTDRIASLRVVHPQVPFSEDDVTDTPASLYAATKKADELLAHTYNHIHGVAITALRFFTVYGAFGRPDMAYFSFANQIAKVEPIKIFQGEDDAGGAKELARDFTFIGDVVSGIIASL